MNSVPKQAQKLNVNCTGELTSGERHEVTQLRKA